MDKVNADLSRLTNDIENLNRILESICNDETKSVNSILLGDNTLSKQNIERFLIASNRLINARQNILSARLELEDYAEQIEVIADQVKMSMETNDSMMTSACKELDSEIEAKEMNGDISVNEKMLLESNVTEEIKLEEVSLNERKLLKPNETKRKQPEEVSLNERQLLKLNATEKDTPEEVSLNEKQLLEPNETEKTERKEVSLNERTSLDPNLTEKVVLEEVSLNKKQVLEPNETEKTELNEVSLNERTLLVLNLTEKVKLKEVSLNEEQLFEPNKTEKTDLKELSLNERTLSKPNLTEKAKLKEVSLNEEQFLELNKTEKTKLKEVSLNERTSLEPNLTEIVALEEVSLNEEQLFEPNETEKTELKEVSLNERTLSEPNLTEKAKLKEVSLNEEQFLELNETEKTELKEVSLNERTLELNLTETVKLEEVSLNEKQLLEPKVAEEIKEVSLNEQKLLAANETEKTKPNEVLLNERKLLEPEVAENIKLAELSLSERTISESNTTENWEEVSLNENKLSNSAESLNVPPSLKNEDEDEDEDILIENCERPNIGDECQLTYVQTLKEFYINLTKNIEELDNLNEMIQKSINEKNVFKSKEEAKNCIKLYCLAHHPEWELWYRAEVISWLSDDEENSIIVKLLDYGDVLFVDHTELSVLPKQFCNHRMAIQCTLKDIYPVGSTPGNVIEEWSPESLSLLTTSIEDPDINQFTISFVGDTINECLEIDLKCFDLEDNSISDTIVLLEHGVRLTSDLMNVGLIKSDLIRSQVMTSQGLSGITSGMSEHEVLDIFLENSVLAQQESVTIGEAIESYNVQDEALRCPFTRTDGTCFKGLHCKLEHTQLREDGLTTEKHEAFISNYYSPEFPDNGDVIQIFVTQIPNSNEFFGHLRTRDYSFDSILELIRNMNRENIVAKYKRFNVIPTEGELVLAQHGDGKWQRAQIVDIENSITSPDFIINIFFVDYGDTLKVPLENLRKIPSDFLRIPFQAVNFRLLNEISLSLHQLYYATVGYSEVNRVFVYIFDEDGPESVNDSGSFNSEIISVKGNCFPG